MQPPRVTVWHRVTADHVVGAVIGPGRCVCVCFPPPFSTGILPAMIKWSVKQGSAHLQRGPVLNELILTFGPRE